LKVLGESVGEIRGNPTAVPVILHTLIDNALKYSKRDSEVRIQFHETDTYIDYHAFSIAGKNKVKHRALARNSLGPNPAAIEMRAPSACRC